MVGGEQRGVPVGLRGQLVKGALRTFSSRSESGRFRSDGMFTGCSSEFRALESELIGFCKRTDTSSCIASIPMRSSFIAMPGASGLPLSLGLGLRFGVGLSVLIPLLARPHCWFPMIR